MGPSDDQATNTATWIAQREIDGLTRRVDKLDARIDRLDEHGTRGVEALRLSFETLKRDLADHETMHTEAARSQTTARRFLIGTVVALVVPLYPVLFWLITLASAAAGRNG